ncbi:hypothetical protein [Roseisolibacter agri]|uniref:Helix-turn-helix domain-containing protein n=1 Tax=Roseisolibacter agri TaxID=2014610 RepID=A0AA37Q286_9BACT|nr:hypothetical protein [Roseisolibacter agri]GLC25044.1 hypothetical protein rosag_15570 [Roseisolibacter agri]
MNAASKDGTPETARVRDEWMSLNQACLALETHREDVLHRAIAGELTAQRIAGRTVISRASVEAAQAAAAALAPST